jgi:cell wall-associated NlpC family hydrolase
MRRSALLAVLVGLAVIGGGLLAMGASGQGGGSTAKRAAATAEADAPGTAKLPPLPARMRGHLSQPTAGGGAGAGGEATPEAQDPGLKNAGPAPKQAASAGGRRLSGVLGSAGGGLHKATALANGVALAPLEAPDAVKQIIEAGNAIARTPYKWGGGHGKWKDTGYDCSGSVSFALAAAGLLNGPLASGPLMSWGRPGPGKWVTIYANPGHVYLVVAGIRFDTSGQRVNGSRWQNDLRTNAGFTARHPAGL